MAYKLIELIDEEKTIGIKPQDVEDKLQSRKSKFQRVKERLLNLMILVTILLVISMALEISGINSKFSEYISSSNPQSNEMVDASGVMDENFDLDIVTNVREENMIDDVEVIKPATGIVDDEHLGDLERLEELRIYDAYDDHNNDHPDWRKVGDEPKPTNEALKIEW